MKFKLPPVAPQPRIPNPSVIPFNAPNAKAIIQAEVARSDIKDQIVDSLMSGPVPSVTPAKPLKEMTKLVDDNFPFDESQLHAVEVLKSNTHACMTGAAGTGKTTTTKKAVQEIVDTLPSVDMTTYFKRGLDNAGDPDDEYEVPESLIPAVACVAFTGRASQQIKKNFPQDWWGNIMTIHRLLAFYPEYYDEFEDGELKKKVRFVPGYTQFNKLPWKVILIDEAGMLGVDLWHQLLAACTDDCRIIMIGDINQLPPTHGKSVFGFAMAKWPTVELTHIHRQKGVNNSIVDNAWRIIKGQYPKSDDPKSNDWKFVMMEIDSDSNKASRQLRKWLGTIRGNLYDPIRDSVITPINAFDETSGFALGQDPLNRELAIQFNSESGRHVIDAGRERKYFAVGDKVMATKNDHEAGITNGMTGIITGLTLNPAYTKNPGRYGLIEDVNEWMAGHAQEVDEDFEMSLEDLSELIQNEPKKQEKEGGRGPSSHIVTVKFGEGDHAFEMSFGSLSEVCSLQVAYVVTCHKMQGGEAPFIVIICHQAHKRMLNREWLYTAVTRASGRCVILYTKMGMSAAINKQTIKGKDLKEKVESFNRMMDPKGLMGAAIKVRIPESQPC